MAKKNTKSGRKQLKGNKLRTKKGRTKGQRHALRSNKNFLDWFMKK